MFLPNHGAPDPDLFWEFIYGLTSPTPYTRLNHPYSYHKDPDDKYLDELGQFNKSRTYVIELLFKKWALCPAKHSSTKRLISHEKLHSIGRSCVGYIS